MNELQTTFGNLNRPLAGTLATEMGRALEPQASYVAPDVERGESGDLSGQGSPIRFPIAKGNTLNDREWGILRLRHEPGHCGAGVEALIEGVWIPCRYECSLTRDYHEPIFYLPNGRTMIPDSDTPCRWPL